jgi:hypothetical protein
VREDSRDTPLHGPFLEVTKFNNIGYFFDPAWNMASKKKKKKKKKEKKSTKDGKKTERKNEDWGEKKAAENPIDEARSYPSLERKGWSMCWHGWISFTHWFRFPQ